MEKTDGIDGTDVNFSLFSKLYPTVPINRLLEQRYDLATDDGCIHYMDRETKKVYSWNYLESKWLYDEDSQEELRKTLFSKYK